MLDQGIAVIKIIINSPDVFKICTVNLLWNINLLCFSLDAFILDSSENLNTESSESFWFLQGTEDWNQFCEHSASMA